MNQDMFDPEIFADFVIEAKEHLETVEPKLLELEKEPDNLDLLNDIFRPMHSLKGASGFLGLNTINSLAHKAENILDELRKGNMQITSRIMDIILATTDALRVMIVNLEQSGSEGSVDVGPIIQSIEEIMASGTSVGIPSTIQEPVGSMMEAGEDGKLAPYSLAFSGEGHISDFLEEAREILGVLNDDLVKLEKDPQTSSPLINDIFRYFHNIKGNSGIIGYRELNALTHEAETLLNRIRQGELKATHGIVDALMATVDQISVLLEKIDVEKGLVRPMDISVLITKLQAVQLDEGEDADPISQESPDIALVMAPREEAHPADLGVDLEDLSIFEQTVGQQFSAMAVCLEQLQKDGSHSESIDAFYRSLTTIQNSAAYMGFEESKVYAERTAKLVDQARNAGIGFDAMTDLLRQEVAILRDMVGNQSQKVRNRAEEPLVTVVKKSKEKTEETIDLVKAPTPLKAKSKAIKSEKKEKPVVPEVKLQRINPEKAPEAVVLQAQDKESAKADKAPEQVKGSSTIRVDHERLDHLMNLIGELIINRNRFALLARALEQQGQGVQQIAQQLTETTYSMARISDDLQDTIMKVRMVPVKTVFSRFPRLVRDLCRKSGKNIELITEGEETELDKSVVEEVGDPLVHLIRNSVDHGMEPEKDRVSAGKDAVGKVWLRAFHRGNAVIIEVEDDGRGIDPDKLRSKVVEKKLMSREEANNLDDQEAIELIFMAGFSTAEKVTDISGRGVGMDVVKNNIKNLKGNVSLSSTLGKGTKITLALPLTLAIIDALIVEVGGDTYAIPLDAVSETTKIEAKKMSEVNERKVVTLRGEVLGIVQLSDMLGLGAPKDTHEILPMVVITVNEKRLGLIVDRLLERQEIVIKSLGQYLGKLHGISGATIMGDGGVVLILDPHEIYMRAVSRIST